MIRLPLLFVLAILQLVQMTDAAIDGVPSSVNKILENSNQPTSTTPRFSFIYSDPTTNGTSSHLSATPLQKRWNGGGEAFSTQCQLCWSFCSRDCDSACCNLGTSYLFPVGGPAVGGNQGIGGGYGGGRGGFGGVSEYGHRHCSGATSILTRPSDWIESYPLSFSARCSWLEGFSPLSRVRFQLLALVFVTGHTI